MMNLELKICKIGDSLGIVLPGDVLSYLQISEGDTICVTEGAKRSLSIKRVKSAELDCQMDAAAEVIQRYRKTFEDLAR